MSLTRPNDPIELFREVRKRSSLKRAWDHVRPRALQSRDPDTKRERAAIEADTLLYIGRLQKDIGPEGFRFDAQKGVLKRRAGKTPRPIVVSPLRNRIVQRAILDVCQSNSRRICRLLGELPKRLATRTSVGGLPERGVSYAVRLIKEAIDGGATHYVRSDLKNFFANLPKQPLHAFLDAEVSDRSFVALFKKALEVELSNREDEDVRQWWSLFPTTEVGVPQGSALSAISANIVLSDFDEQLNSGTVTTIRYLDDFVILGPSEATVASAWTRAETILAGLGLEAHQPGQSDKAAKGTVAQGFEFLSFRVQGRTIAPSRKAKDELSNDVALTIRDAKKSILASAEPRRAQHRFIQTMELVDRKIRGWGDAFQETTQRVEFTQLDDRLGKQIDAFIGWFLSVQKGRSSSEQRRMWGVALLRDAPPPGDDGLGSIPSALSSR